jgi:hypothetical protein
MARRVFFSFHYERDISRANVGRNSWVTQDREAAGFFDAGLWEEAKRNGDAAIKKMIDDALVGSSVTAVLIGAETANRDYVRYEIEMSRFTSKGLLGIYIHNIKNLAGQVDPQGANPFDRMHVEEGGRRILYSSLYRTYSWSGDDGYANFGTWVEAAAGAAGR